MHKYYFFLGGLGIVVATIIIAGFIVSGNPFEQQARALDQQRISDFTNIKYAIESYYQTEQKLPERLEDLKTQTNLTDPKTKKQYDYKITSPANFELCTDFATDTKNTPNTSSWLQKFFSGTVQASMPIVPDLYQYDANAHPKGYYCINYQLSSYLYPILTPTPMSAIYTLTSSKQLFNGSFEDWSNPVPEHWTLTPGSQITKSKSAQTGSFAIEFDSRRAQSILISEKVRTRANESLDINVWHQSNSLCLDCAFIGIQFFDNTGAEIISDVDNCGIYNTSAQTWYFYIQGNTSTYKEFKTTCVAPTNAREYIVKFGTWNGPDAEWRFDDISVSPKPALSYPNALSTTEPCKTPLENGMCELSNCSYSYPNDIYTKGRIIVGDAFRQKYGRPSGTFVDTCSVDQRQVIEMVCSSIDEGFYDQGGATYDCPNGCMDGICLE